MEWQGENLPAGILGHGKRTTPFGVRAKGRLVGKGSGIVDQGLDPSAADKQRVAENIGLTRDIASRDLASLSSEGQARLSENFASRGIQGSSFEAVDRAILERDLTRQGANLIDRSRQEGNQQLMQLPLQRAQLQLGANQQLFQGLLGAAGPLLGGLLQNRLAQGTSQEKTFDPAAAVGTGAGAGAKIAGLF